MGGGGKGSKKVTVGYRYSWDVQAGLGRGPVNEIVSIMADKKTVFAGTPGQISSSTSVYIDKPGLFGGDDDGAFRRALVCELAEHEVGGIHRVEHAQIERLRLRG